MKSLKFIIRRSLTQRAAASEGDENSSSREKENGNCLMQHNI